MGRKRKDELSVADLLAKAHEEEMLAFQDDPKFKPTASFLSRKRKRRSEAAESQPEAEQPEPAEENSSQPAAAGPETLPESQPEQPPSLAPTGAEDDDFFDFVAEPTLTTSMTSTELKDLSMSLLVSSSRKLLSNPKRISRKERAAVLSSIESKPINQQSLLDVIFATVLPSRKSDRLTAQDRAQKELKRQMLVIDQEQRSEFVFFLASFVFVPDSDCFFSFSHPYRVLVRRLEKKQREAAESQLQDDIQLSSDALNSTQPFRRPAVEDNLFDDDDVPPTQVSAAPSADLDDLDFDADMPLTGPFGDTADQLDESMLQGLLFWPFFLCQDFWGLTIFCSVSRSCHQH